MLLLFITIVLKDELVQVLLVVLVGIVVISIFAGRTQRAGMYTFGLNYKKAKFLNEFPPSLKGVPQKQENISTCLRHYVKSPAKA